MLSKTASRPLTGDVILPSRVHYCADLLWSEKRGGAAWDRLGRQLLRSISVNGNYVPPRGKLTGEGTEGEEEEKVKEKTCIQWQMGLTPDFSNYLNSIQFYSTHPGI